MRRGKTTTSKVLGRHVVADSRVCHGQPTFRGTRVLVADVLEQVATGLSFEAIIEEWNKSIDEEAIAEALQLAIRSFIKHSDEFVFQKTPA